jgi:hypothetical protein
LLGIAIPAVQVLVAPGNQQLSCADRRAESEKQQGREGFLVVNGIRQPDQKCHIAATIRHNRVSRTINAHPSE